MVLFKLTFGDSMGARMVCQPRLHISPPPPPLTFRRGSPQAAFEGILKRDPFRLDNMDTCWPQPPPYY